MNECQCGREFSTPQGLGRHRKKCKTRTDFENAIRQMTTNDLIRMANRLLLRQDRSIMRLERQVAEMARLLGAHLRRVK
jgi:hypothetical protein